MSSCSKAFRRVLVGLMDFLISCISAASLLAHGLALWETILVIAVFMLCKYGLKELALRIDAFEGWRATALVGLALIVWGIVIDLDAFHLLLELLAQVFEGIGTALWESALEDCPETNESDDSSDD